MSTYGIALYFVIAIPLVLGENNPPSLRDELKPDFIRCTACEGITVASILNAVRH